MRLSFLVGFVFMFSLLQTTPAPHIITWETLLKRPEVKFTVQRLLIKGQSKTAAQYLRCMMAKINSSKGIIGTNGFVGQNGIITTNGRCFVGQNGIITTNGKIFKN